MPRQRVMQRVVGIVVCATVMSAAHAMRPVRQGVRGDGRGAATSPPAQDKMAADLVGGRVVSTDGRPVAHAVVSLTDVNSGRELVTVRSGVDGQYRFGPLPAGKYRLGARAAGYIDGLYQQHEQFSTAIVLGAGLPTSALELLLTPEAVIYGRVTDEAGDPVHRASVTLFRQVGPAMAAAEIEDPGSRATHFRTAMTEDTGEYRLEKVPPGSYFLAVSGVPWYATHPPLVRSDLGRGYRAAIDPALDVAYPEVFYPGALKSEEASAIPLKGGERMIANLQLHAERAVTVQLQAPAPGAPSGGMARFPQLTRTVFGVEEQVQTQGETDGVTFRLTGLVPGQYQVQEPQQTGAVQRGSVDVTGAGATLNLADLQKLQTNVTVKVRVAEGAALPQDLQVRLRGLRSGNTGFGIPVAKVNENGTADLADVGAGTYRLTVWQGGRVLPLVGLAVDGAAVSTLRLRVPEGSGKLAVTASVVARAMQVEGLVRRDGKPVSGSMVVLVPAGPLTGTDLIRRDQSDLDGSFVLRGVIPGNYLLLAVQDGWPLVWTDMTVMARYLAGGIPVTVPAGSGPAMRVKEDVVPQPR